MFPSTDGIKDIVLHAIDEYQSKGNPIPDLKDPKWLDFLAAYILNSLEESLEDMRPKEK